MIQIKNKLTNEVVLNLELDNLKNADLNNVNLSYANLRGANLTGIDLTDSDLKYTNLNYANLNYTDLSYTNFNNADLNYASLIDADLSNANLSYANLNNANLKGVNLINAIGNMKEICSMQLDKWQVVFTKDILAIGCQQHKIEEWKNFNNDRIHEMHSDALVWWEKWKDLIFLTIKLKYIE